MFASVEISKWEELLVLAPLMPSWIFRGQASDQWVLQTSLERAATAGGTAAALRVSRELWILRQFQRRAHLLVDTAPPDHELLEWYALLQHHGGPTRLLDFTQSLYIAVFFAVEAATAHAAVWCIDRQYLDRLNGRDAATETTYEANRRYVSLVEAMLSGRSAARGLFHAEPNRLNERMAIQKGVFVIPGNISESFMTNLATVTGVDVETQHTDPTYQLAYDQFTKRLSTPASPAVTKLIIRKEVHNQAIHQLASMNVEPTVLFPGLDGFARSLHRFLRMPVVASIAS